jgi:hypothetical protein
MEAKVLLAAPINIVKEYCIYDWLEMLRGLSYPNLDIFLVDNSPTPEFAQKINSLGFNCVWENPRGREIRYVMCISNERTRIKFLSDSTYTHFFSLECDIFTPADIVEKLLAHNLDVIGTTYFTYQGAESRLQLRTIYPFVVSEKKHNVSYRVRYLTFAEAQRFMDGKVKYMYENGMGCKLITRRIMEAIPFRIDPLDTGFADSFFSQDLWKNQIDNWIDTSIIPKHRNSNWNTVANDRGHKVMGINKGVFKQGNL